jgi:hypothetical protein
MPQPLSLCDLHNFFLLSLQCDDACGSQAQSCCLAHGCWLLLQVQVQKANGEFGVDRRPSQPVRFTYSPIITRVDNNVGSVPGGSLLQLSSPAAAFNVTDPSQNTVSVLVAQQGAGNLQGMMTAQLATVHALPTSRHCAGALQVLVAGLPCVVQAGSVTATSLSCRVPSLAGQLLAEFWQMPSGTSNLPNGFSTFTNPGPLQETSRAKHCLCLPVKVACLAPLS